MIGDFFAAGNFPSAYRRLPTAKYTFRTVPSATQVTCRCLFSRENSWFLRVLKVEKSIKMPTQLSNDGGRSLCPFSFSSPPWCPVLIPIVVPATSRDPIENKKLIILLPGRMSSKQCTYVAK